MDIFKLIEVFAQASTQESQNPEEDEKKYPGITAKRVSAIRILQELYRISPYYKNQINKVLNHLVKISDENYNRYNLTADGLNLSLPDLDGVMGAMVSCWQEPLAINRMGQVMKALADYPDTYDPTAAAARLKEGAKRGNINMTDAVASRKDVLKAMAKDNFVPEEDFDISEVPELEEEEDPEIQANVNEIMDFVTKRKNR